MTEINEWLDLTYPINANMPVWPGQPSTAFEMADRLCEGGTANVTTLAMSLHSGTHIDAPCHFIEGGLDIQAMPPDLMQGSARVVEIDASVKHITKPEIKDYEQRAGALLLGDRVLFRTRNTIDKLMCRSEFDDTYVAIAPDAAEYLVERMVSLVGVDYLSVAPFDDPETTHRTLLKAGVWVVEGLDLREVGEGNGEVRVMPIRIEGSDAAPARVFYKEDKK